MDRDAAGTAGLLERDAELAVVRGLIAATQTNAGQVLLVQGPAGIGKTALLGACAEQGAEAGMIVLRALGDEITRASSFAATRELLWSAWSQIGVRSSGAVALARPVFADDAHADVSVDRAAAVLHGLHWLVASLAERAPVVLAVDDAHWLDPASGRFLAYLARRVAQLPVMMVVTARPAEGPEGVAESLVAAGAKVLRPRPLSEGASETLVRRELGGRAGEELCRSCHLATGGNPFYLRELTAALREQGGRPTVAKARSIQAQSTTGVARSVLGRLSRLGDDCQRLAGAVTILAPGSPMRLVATLAGVTRDRAERAADRLRAGDLLDSGQPLAFAHPIVRGAIAAEMAVSQRARLHARAARLLHDDGSPIERVAAHLLFAEPYGDAWVVHALREAARTALARGAPEAAVSYLHRALAEPPASDERFAVTLELGHAQALLPGPRKLDALHDALGLATCARRRAEVSLELGWALASTGQASALVSLLEAALEPREQLDAALVESIEGLLIGGGAADLSATRRVLARCAGHFERARRGDPCDPLRLAPALAQTGAITGLTAAQATALARRALADPGLLDTPPAYLGATSALCWCDQLAEAARALEVAIAEAQRRGSAPMFMQMSNFRAGVAFRAGELTLAEALGERAWELADELGAGHYGLMLLLPILVERGRASEAADLIAAHPLSEPALGLWQGAIVLAERGRARVALGELGPGVEDLLDADRRMSAAGCQLGVLADWARTAALALDRLGCGREARQLAERELEQARMFGAARRLGMALSTCGLLEAGERGLARCREAIEVLGSSPARLEHARAQVDLGANLVACDRLPAAREPLARGLDFAHRAGAVTLAQRAKHLLQAAGARPRRAALSGPAALTPAERRTALMAADGLSNRRIAEALFLSSKTVEAQLSQTYAKLQISGRAHLAAALRLDG